MKYNGNSTLNEIVETVEKLVEFKTTPSNFDEFERAVEYIENYFADTTIIINKEKFNNYPALHISNCGTKHSSVMMQAHVDVVDGNDNQFLPVVKNGKMYGRGTADMKGFVAIAMKLMREYENQSNDISLALVLTFDEEIGSENGAKKMAELGYTGDLIINGDAGYNYSVIYGEKGILKIILKVEATPGRHPYTWEGKNAFELLVEDYNSIISLFKNKDIATNDDNWHTTYSIYDVNVKNEKQYPPHYAEAKMNFYFTEDLTVSEIYNLINKKIKHCKVKQFIGSERVFINPKNYHIKKLHEILTYHFKRKIEIRTENGSSDARFYANDNIPIVILKPVGEDHHGDNENLDINSLLPLFNSLREFISICHFNYKDNSHIEAVDVK